MLQILTRLEEKKTAFRWCVSAPFSIQGAKLFLNTGNKRYESRKPPVFCCFQLSMFANMNTNSPGLKSDIISHHKYFPRCHPALSLGPSVHLFVDIAAVDISVLLLFSLTLPRGRPRFLRQFQGIPAIVWDETWSKVASGRGMRNSCVFCREQHLEISSGNWKINGLKQS